MYAYEVCWALSKILQGPVFVITLCKSQAAFGLHLHCNNASDGHTSCIPRAVASVINFCEAEHFGLDPMKQSVVGSLLRIHMLV